MIPVGSQIVIIKDIVSEIHGIALAEESGERATTGIIKAVGPEEIGFKVGDRVLFGPYDGMHCVIDGDYRNKFVIMDSSCVRAYIKKAQ